jgi:sarcosine oxidase
VRSGIRRGDGFVEAGVVRDILIIGGGMAGLSAAYYLRHRGSDVHLVEADRLGSPRASSAGQTRMYREMYSDPFLCARARDANAMWRQLERDHALPLRRPHGLLFYGESWDEETIEGSIPGARRVMLEQGIPFEELDAAAIADRFPLRPHPSHTGLFEPTAGALLADRVLDLFAGQARSAGVRIEERRRVAVVDPSASGVSVRFADGETVRYREVVLAAGHWTTELLSTLGIRLPLRTWGMLWAHYEVDPSRASSYPQWFCFQRPRGDDGGLYYGFPVVDGCVIKAGIDWAPPSMQVDEPRALPAEPDRQTVERLDDFLAHNLVGVGRRVETRVSPYSMTPDVQFVLDRVAPGLVTFTGGSGQAFKFAPLIGGLLADLVQGNAPRCDVGPWRADRFA